MLYGHSKAIKSLDFRETTLASASFDCAVKLWRPDQTNKPIHTMKHKWPVYAVKFGDKSLYSCSHDQTTSVWNVATGEELASIKHPS